MSHSARGTRQPRKDAAGILLLCSVTLFLIICTMKQPRIEIIAVAHRRLGELKVFVQSILNQNRQNWTLKVIHDGPDAEFESAMRRFAKESANRISFFCTPTRYNDYGHSLREQGLEQASGDFILLTNADNYYAPRLVEFVTEAIEQTTPDAVMYDMIHSHDNPGGRGTPAYSFFSTEYGRLQMDMGAVVVRRELAMQAGFPDKSHDGDATYFERVARIKGQATAVCKIKRVLMVHN
jgi:glycosyltransferase involved in cell wall biosynthesis